MDTRIPKHILARAYSPKITPTAARKKLMLWITSCKPLYRALKRGGYSDRNKFFTHRQIQLIYRYLGEP